MNDLSNTELALLFKKGDQKAGQKLLDNFDNLIKSFADLLYYGDIKKSNKTINNFINLLVGNKTDNKKDRIYKNLKVINERYSSFDYSDIVQDLKLAFLSFVVDFDPEKLSKNSSYKFESYVSKNFHYKVKKETIDNIVDMPIYYTGELDIDEFPGTNGLEYIIFGINESWIDGETCSDVFKKLDKSERKLVKEIYIDDKKVKDVAERYGITDSAISHRVKKIKNKLK